MEPIAFKKTCDGLTSRGFLAAFDLTAEAEVETVVKGKKKTSKQKLIVGKQYIVQKSKAIQLTRPGSGLITLIESDAMQIPYSDTGGHPVVVEVDRASLPAKHPERHFSTPFRRILDVHALTVS